MATTYDSSDDALYVRVSVPELEALIAKGARPVARDGGKLVHLLRRVLSTMSTDAAAIVQLRRQIMTLESQSQQVGQATTLSPLDALRYLDDHQRELLFDRITRERLAHLRQLVGQAEESQAQLGLQLEQVRSALMAVSMRPDLPGQVRADFTRLLASLPEQVATVNHPPMIDYPDPEPPTGPLATPVTPPGTAHPTTAASPAPPAQQPTPHPVPQPVPQGRAQVGGQVVQEQGPAAGPVTATPPTPASPDAFEAFAAPAASPGEVAAPAYVNPWAATDPSRQVQDAAPVFQDPWRAAGSPQPGVDQTPPGSPFETAGATPTQTGGGPAADAPTADPDWDDFEVTDIAAWPGAEPPPRPGPAVTAPPEGPPRRRLGLRNRRT